MRRELWKSMKIKELYSSENKWCQHVSAKDNDGRWCQIEKGTAFCLLGACYKCYGYSNFQEISNRIHKELSRNSDKKMTISIWNDDKDRKFAEVKELVERLDI